MASGIAGTSMIFASRVFHCAPKMADPSRVIRSTLHTGGSAGAMAGCGEANGRTGVAASMTGGATTWDGVGMAAPLLVPPAMSVWVGGRGVTQSQHGSPGGLLDEGQDPGAPGRDGRGLRRLLPRDGRRVCRIGPPGASGTTCGAVPHPHRRVLHTSDVLSGNQVVADRPLVCCIRQRTALDRASDHP